MRTPVDRILMLVLGCVVVGATLPLFFTSDLINPRGDFTQYAARHEQLRQAVVDEGLWPAWSHRVGGGYPVIGDPEDPSMNPLALLTIAFGTITGLKLLGVLSMVSGALGTFVFVRDRLGVSSLAAFLGALSFGLALWIPVRMLDGNPNEVYYGFVPLLLWLFTAPKFRLWTIVPILYVMLSDGKLCFVTSVLFLLLLALTGLPGRTAGPLGIQLVLRGAMALAILVACSLFRILPALEVISETGSLSRMKLWFHANDYGPKTINAYTPSRLLWESLGVRSDAGVGQLTSICVGPATVLLAMLGSLLALRRAWPWVLSIGLFGWLALAHRAPLDLFKLLWDLPVFNAIDAPAKYFSAPLVISLSILASLGADHLLRKWPHRVMRAAVLLAALASSLFLAQKVWTISSRNYTYALPAEATAPVSEFFQVKSDSLWRGRFQPFASNTYINILRGVGTIDWYTGIPLPEVAIPRFVIKKDGEVVANDGYRGEAWSEVAGTPITVTLHYNSITLECDASFPGGIVIINQSFHSDWTPVEPEGTPLSISRSATGLLQVHVPQDTRRVALRFVPAGFRRGVASSGVAVVLVLMTGWVWRKRRLSVRA